MTNGFSGTKSLYVDGVGEEFANSFTLIQAQDRLTRVTTYLRRQYYYCFWCGTQYDNEQDLSENCPGEEEDAHD